jgi:hypothetical protein
VLELRLRAAVRNRQEVVLRAAPKVVAGHGCTCPVHAVGEPRP